MPNARISFFLRPLATLSEEAHSQLSTMNTQLVAVQLKEIVDFEEELAGGKS